MRSCVEWSGLVLSAVFCALLTLLCATLLMAQNTVRFEAESFSGMSPVTDSTCVGGAYAWYNMSNVTLNMSASGTWYVWVRYASSSTRLLDVTINGTVTHMPTTSSALKWNLAGSTTNQTIGITLQGVGSSVTKVDSVIFTTDSSYDPGTKTLADWNALPVLTPAVQVPPVRVEVENLMGTYAFDYGTEYLDGESACIGYPVYGGTEGKVMLPDGTGAWYAWISYYSNNNERDLDVTLNGATTYFHDTYNLWQWQRIGTVNSGEVDIKLVSSGTMSAVADSIIFTPSSGFDPNAMTIAQLSAITEIPRTKEFAEQWLIDNPSGTTAAWIDAVRSYYGYPLVNRVPPIDSYGNITYKGTPVFPLLMDGRDTTGTALNTSFGWPDQTWQVYGMEYFYYAWEDYDHWAKNFNRSADPMAGRPNAPFNYIIDEPENIGLSDIECERLNDLVNMMDPNVATLINVSPSDATRASVLTIPDVVSLDRYPIDHYSQTIAENASCFDSLRYYSDIRPAMFIAQAWQWTTTSRWPTLAEERAMTYLALVHNARGLEWFQWPTPSGGTIASDNPALWADMQVMFSEISQIFPCLQGPEVFQPYTATVISPVGASAAEFRLAVSADRSQAALIAVNPYQSGNWPQTVRLDFTAGPLTDAYLSPKFTGQTASIAQVAPGVWNLTFSSAPASGVFTLVSTHLGSLTQMSRADVKNALISKWAFSESTQVNYGMYTNNIIYLQPQQSYINAFPTRADLTTTLCAVGGNGTTAGVSAVNWTGPGNAQITGQGTQYANVFWHFHTDAPGGFAAGWAASVNFNYNAAAAGHVRGFVGMDTTSPVVSDPQLGTTTWNPATTENIWGSGAGSGNLARTVTMALPAGTRDAYFGFVCNSSDTDVITVHSVSVAQTSGIRAIKDVKAATDGASVSISNTLVSGAFTDYFYIESDDRTSGIRVNMTANGLSIPTRADVIGTVATVNGERCIAASEVSVVSSADTVKPLGMTNKALGGGDYQFFPASHQGQQGVSGGFGLNNIGLLIKTAGSVSNSNSSSFNITDGSAVVVTVACPAGSAPVNGSFVSVAGISTCDGPGGYRLIRVRSASDIQ